jgi:hypothetical protein
MSYYIIVRRIAGIVRFCIAAGFGDMIIQDDYSKEQGFCDVKLGM